MPIALLPLTANDPGLTTLSLVNHRLLKVQRLWRCDFGKYQILIYCMGIMRLMLYFSPPFLRKRLHKKTRFVQFFFVILIEKRNFAAV